MLQIIPGVAEIHDVKDNKYKLVIHTTAAGWDADFSPDVLLSN